MDVTWDDYAWDYGKHKGKIPCAWSMLSTKDFLKEKTINNVIWSGEYKDKIYEHILCSEDKDKYLISSKSFDISKW